MTMNVNHNYNETKLQTAYLIKPNKTEQHEKAKVTTAAITEAVKRVTVRLQLMSQQ